jgi:hypothetical protein
MKSAPGPLNLVAFHGHTRFKKSRYAFSITGQKAAVEAFEPLPVAREIPG